MPHTRHPEDRLQAAIEARRPILDDPTTNTCRILNGRADGIDGLVIERFADVLVAQLHEGRFVAAEPVARSLCTLAAERLGARAVYLKRFVASRSDASAELDQRHRDPTPWIGEPVAEEIDALEHGLTYRIRPYDGFSVGLFLEQRANRRRIRQLAEGRSVLNTFAYTCGFSIAAAAGGAASTVNVDLSKRFLEWGKRNFTANDMPLDTHRFICSDTFDYYRRAARQKRVFDLIILDPPTFSRTKGRSQPFVLAEQLGRLVHGAIELLSPGGLLLLCTNHRATPRAALEEAILRGAAPRPATIAERPRLPLDFRGDSDYAKSVFARID